MKSLLFVVLLFLGLGLLLSVLPHDHPAPRSTPPVVSSPSPQRPSPPVQPLRPVTKISRRKQNPPPQAPPKPPPRKPDIVPAGDGYLHGVRDGFGYAVKISENGGQYIILYVIAENWSKRPQVLRPYALPILDAPGSMYLPTTVQNLNDDGGGTLAVMLNPGTSVLLKITYQVPFQRQTYYFPFSPAGDSIAINH